MTAEIKTSIALKLHAYGLTQLHDPNWTGMELFDRLKQHVRGRQDPTTLLFKTLRNGLLYHLAFGCMTTTSSATLTVCRLAANTGFGIWKT